MNPKSENRPHVEDGAALSNSANAAVNQQDYTTKQGATSIADLPNWVGYRLKPKLKNGQPVLKPNGKPKTDKIPINPLTGYNAKTNDPTTWGTFAKASQAIEKYGLDGIGLVLTDEAGVVGIDLDDCILADGTLTPFAQAQMGFFNSYTELSPSGDGLHVLVRGSIPHAVKRDVIEIYGNGRFLTYTGQRFNGMEKPIANRQQQLDQFFAQQARQQAAGVNGVYSGAYRGNGETAVTLDDQALLDRAMNAGNGDKFSRLWRGGISDYGSQSEADFALCHLLAFWTGNDAAAMERLFRQSGLYREKWDERHYSDGSTYGQMTIARAIENNDTVYEGGQQTAEKGNIPAHKNADEPYAIFPLPAQAYLDPALGVNASPWLDAYVAFSRQMSPRGFEGFHEAIGLWLLSTVAARRLILHMGTKRFSPNLYIALCAFTTLYAKTTTARVGLDVLQQAGLVHLLLPNDLTPQAFLHQLVPQLRADYGDMLFEEQAWEKQRLQFAGQRGWFYEEFGTKVKAMMRDGGVMADFRGLLRSFDDNPPHYEYVTMTRRDKIYQPYLAMLANLTPADIRPFAKPGAALWGDGFWARWAFMTPPVGHAPQMGRFPERAESIPITLIEPLRNWHQALGIPYVSIEEITDDEGDATGKFRVNREPITAISIELGTGVADAFYAYHDALVGLAAEQADSGNSDLIGNYGRLSEKAMRIAMLLAGVGNGNRIEIQHWARAQTITEGWRTNLHHLAEQVSTPAPSQERQLEDKIMTVLQRHGAMTAAEIGRNVRGVGSAEVEQFCQRLIRSGAIVVAETTKRNTKRYVLP